MSHIPPGQSLPCSLMPSLTVPAAQAEPYVVYKMTVRNELAFGVDVTCYWDPVLQQNIMRVKSAGPLLVEAR